MANEADGNALVAAHVPYSFRNRLDDLHDLLRYCLLISSCGALLATHAMWAAGGVVLIALLAAVELGRMPSTTAVVAVGMSAQVWPGSSTGLVLRQQDNTRQRMVIPSTTRIHPASVCTVCCCRQSQHSAALPTWGGV